ncbi:MAG: ribosome silencing factor [Eubacterium sp.]|jgi:ribosome-associated protein
MNSKETALLSAKVLDDKKAIDIEVIDISEKSSFADYLVICTGGSMRQVAALSDDVEQELAKEGIFARDVEGKSGTGWILLDFGDVIVNVFSESMREKYNLEKVWGDCPFVDTGVDENGRTL